MMAVDFVDRVVLVAGASGDIGHSAAAMMLQRGARLTLQYRGNSKPVDGLLEEFGSDRVLAVRAEMTQRDVVENLVSATVERYGKLDGLLDTVGYGLRLQPFLDVEEETIDRTIDVEFRSIVLAARAVLPTLIRNQGGRIVIVASDSGKVGTSGEAISAACRGAVIALGKSLAREYAREGVLVNVVCPGPTDTQLWRDLVDHDDFGSKIGSAMVKTIPLRRLARPEEVAAAAVFLLSPDASFITGQAISVSGGLTMS